MITQIKIANFRSLKEASIDIGKLSIFIGSNAAGKTSVLYGLLVLKNFITNPNQSLDSLFILPSAGSPFINLGTFQHVIFNKDEKASIRFEIHINDKINNKDIKLIYSVIIGKIQSYIELKCIEPFDFTNKIEISIPYQANKYQNYECKFDNIIIKYQWNGLSNITNINIQPLNNSQINADFQRELINILLRIFSLPFEELNKVDFIPIKRGFTKSSYATMPLQQITTEDEIASLIATDRDITGKITSYLEMIIPKIFQVFTIPGTASFYLQVTDKETKLVTDIVNEGFGTNQLINILAKILQKNKSLITIDEPEIHLHPSIIDKLVDTLVDITKNEDKNLLITTHSEHFIESLLRNVSEKKIQPKDVKIYYLYKSKKETIVEQQEVNEVGQIKGGLKSFYETELKNWKGLLKIKDEE